MQCPSCKEIAKDKVVDSRPSDGGKTIRRRRECTVCHKRYTTKERIEEEVRLTVIKKNGSRMPFDVDRVLSSMRHACYKRPTPLETLQREAAAIQEQLARGDESEVPSRTIGMMVCKRLRDLDHVAYVRFASIYHEFRDLDDMLEEIELVKEAATDSDPGQQALFD